MKNNACVIIDNCADCPHMCRSHYYKGSDSWLCEYHGDLTVIAHGVEVEDEYNVEIPNWCPILQPEGVYIQSPKPFQLKP